ncbi:cation diffusion facilitator family transporter [Agrococcus sp. SGAir0287]|uniref:cation diffusion facilitator family transporter n=1 Tax=Agrococcus sp. SGAir0287 TaxID=2070347 RepID=UPI0010CD3B39|nr:cation diffusion facilitator family transporter [Agrococcus sp. SGAir0287]QCR19020.1 cation transporter [Agrococcus sp. SGAir0287]
MGAGHDHGHAHGAVANRRRLAIAFGITATVLVVQAVGAVVTGSLALLVDTGHMLTDVGGLALSLVAATLAMRPPTSRRTWGFARAEVLSAAVQAGILLAIGVLALVEGARRLLDPPEVEGGSLLVFGILGLVANVIAIGVLVSARDANLNLRAAFLEVVNDALGSVAVIVSAIVIATTGFVAADALAAMLVACLIIPRAFVLLRASSRILLEETPEAIDLDAVRDHILGLDHVAAVHDLHASQIATGLPVLTAHVVVDDGCFRDGHGAAILAEVQSCIADHFDVEHSTIQVEPASHREPEHHA